MPFLARSSGAFVICHLVYARLITLPARTAGCRELGFYFHKVALVAPSSSSSSSNSSSHGSIAATRHAVPPAGRLGRRRSAAVFAWAVVRQEMGKICPFSCGKRRARANADRTVLSGTGNLRGSQAQGPWDLTRTAKSGRTKAQIPGCPQLSGDS